MNPNRVLKSFNVIHFYVAFLMIYVFKNEVIMIQKALKKYDVFGCLVWR